MSHKSDFYRHKNASNLAGNSAAILWDYLQGGGIFTKIMKTSKIEHLRVYCQLNIQSYTTVLP